MPDIDTTPNGWTSRDKFAAVMETSAMSETDVAAFCREKGIFPEQLSQWHRSTGNSVDQGTKKGKEVWQ